jgi:hypothetical protein
MIMKSGEGMISIQIEAMTPTDWAQVRTIYLEGIASNQATFESKPRLGRSGTRAITRLLGWWRARPAK